MIPSSWLAVFSCMVRYLLALPFLIAATVPGAVAQDFEDFRAGPVLKFLYTIPSAEDSLKLLSRPVALSVDPLGHLYVADADLHRILLFDRTGKLIRFVGGIGSGREQFDVPSDIWAEDGLNVYVADRNNHRIHLFDRQLNEVSIIPIGPYGDEEKGAGLPSGIAVSASGDLFISELEGNSLLKLSSFWRRIARIGQLESGPVPLERPGQLAVVEGKWVACVDEKSAAVLLFDYYGNFLREIRGRNWEQPNGIFYWKSRKLLLVADPGAAAIYVFRPEGQPQPVRPIGRAPLEIWKMPVDVAAYQDRLFVADAARARVLVYQWVSNSE